MTTTKKKNKKNKFIATSDGTAPPIKSTGGPLVISTALPSAWNFWKNLAEVNVFVYAITPSIILLGFRHNYMIVDGVVSGS